MTQPGYQQQPGYPQQPAYRQSGYGGGADPLPAGGASRRNVLGLISLIVGVAISLLQFLSQIGTTFVVINGGPIQLVTTIVLVITGLLALTALGLGIAGLLRKAAPKAAAAAGTALGGAALFGVVTAALMPFIYDAFY